MRAERTTRTRLAELPGGERTLATRAASNRPLRNCGTLAPMNSSTSVSQTRSFTTVFLIEMWERFGYYGMQALIVYYMIERLNFPDERATVVWGAAAALIYVA